MRQAALLVALVCVLAVPVAGSAGVAGPAEQPLLQAGQHGQQALQDEETPAREGVDVTVQIQSDGAAEWNVSAKYALEDANDTAAFEELRQEFEAYETNSEFSVDVFRAVVPDVSDSVGRSMEIRNPERTSAVVPAGNNTSVGVLSVEFTWTNFSRVGNETLVVDSFAGGWFGDLRDGQRLTVRPPEGYDTDQVQPATSISEGAYVWTGPQAFAPGEPRAVFSEDDPSGPTSGVSLLIVGGVGGLALLLGAVLAWAYYRDRESGFPAGLPSVSSWFDGGDGGAPSDGAAAASGEPDGGAASEPADAGAEPVAAAGDEPAESDDVDLELLSDEERVERLLREHGGRMKQSRIVEETRWSTAKVSQLLSSMDDEDRVEKLRIGRENLISLPDEDVGEE
ncbi:helix-turn-helix transcriptional regulator [Halobacterium yunchengense]|uniref:helix-turn-helix transcriptional regulator n=1 Tax=Halobacterium yunchengense TaxID=3108497 RepID=UPI00300AC04F